MKKGFNLSNKFHFGDDRTVEESGDRYYLEQDVKEFIRRLKELVYSFDLEAEPTDSFWEEIRRLAGSELIGEEGNDD